MTDSELHPGLEGVAVAETSLSDINGEAGELVIRGYPVHELAANATFEESVFLLLNDRLPTEEELIEFRADLATRRAITDEVRDLLRTAAAEGKPAMDALRMGIATANLGTAPDDSEGVARRLIAVAPTIVTTYWQYRQGNQPVAPRANLGHAANYLYMLTGDEPTGAAVRGLETYLNTVIDHGLNASTFAARVVVSTESDLVSAATAAVGALKGPLHGGAPGPVLDMLRTVHETDDHEGYVRETLEAGDRLMGFGHRVYRVRDPRASVLATAAERYYRDRGDSEFFETVEAFERTAVEVLAEYYPDRRLETNVEFYTAVLLDGVGVPKGLFTATFSIARMAGWMAHALEQAANNRLVRPRARYIGPSDRDWVPLDER